MAPKINLFHNFYPPKQSRHVFHFYYMSLLTHIVLVLLFLSLPINTSCPHRIQEIPTTKESPMITQSTAQVDPQYQGITGTVKTEINYQNQTAKAYHLQTGRQYRAPIDREGYFTFGNLPSGTYEVKISLDKKSKTVKLSNTEALHLDFHIPAPTRLVLPEYLQTWLDPIHTTGHRPGIPSTAPPRLLNLNPDARWFLDTCYHVLRTIKLSLMEFALFLPVATVGG